MINESTQHRLSELVDGELSSDEINRLLVEVLPDSSRRAALIQQLRLRLALAPWRGQSRTSVVGGVIPPPSHHRWNSIRRLLPVAAMLALIVTVIVLSWPRASSDKPVTAGREVDGGSIAAISMEEVARVLQLHETIAGPVSWLALSADTVRVGSSTRANQEAEAIACFLDIKQHGSVNFPRTPDVVICRSGRRATLSIPSQRGASNEMQIQLAAAPASGKPGIWYTVRVAGGDTGQPRATLLTGFLPIDEANRSIGRLAFGDTTLDLAMSAEVLTQSAGS